MAWFTTPLLREPSVCAGVCQHTDCVESRRIVATHCHYCDELIGEDVKYYLESPQGRPVHAVCVWAREDAAG